MPAGKLFLRVQPRSLSEGLPVPLQLQLIEPCSSMTNQDLPNGRNIRGQRI
jgi:hypothetical protein